MSAIIFDLRQTTRGAWLFAGACALFLTACGGSPATPSAITFAKESFESENSPDLDGELGFLTVPENHDEPRGRTITRLRAM